MASLGGLLGGQQGGALPAAGGGGGSPHNQREEIEEAVELGEETGGMRELAISMDEGDECEVFTVSEVQYLYSL